jgi:hypothetical protein
MCWISISQKPRCGHPASAGICPQAEDSTTFSITINRRYDKLKGLYLTFFYLQTIHIMLQNSLAISKLCHAFFATERRGQNLSH